MPITKNVRGSAVPALAEVEGGGERQKEGGEGGSLLCPS